MCCRFAALYEKVVPATLFDRLEFIMCRQEWGPLSDTFWLGHALVGLQLTSPTYLCSKAGQTAAMYKLARNSASARCCSGQRCCMCICKRQSLV